MKQPPVLPVARIILSIVFSIALFTHKEQILQIGSFMLPILILLAALLIVVLTVKPKL